jgi:2-polyprenyl-3-methyl-5-hydroxy-6-metoxy-1,4-benzoquinol methylase
MICRICSNSEHNRAFRIREMLLGLGTESTYFECSQCGALQIVDIPSNLEDYYPPDYYSFRRKHRGGPLERYMRVRRDRHALLNDGSLLGNLLCHAYPEPTLAALARVGVGDDSRVLDVGCGAGRLLFSLDALGIRSLTGIDPHVPADFSEGSVRILRKGLHELPPGREFDVVMFDHSLEHIPDQLETLRKVSEILTDAGVCLVRTPVKTEYIWKRYGVDWVQIDAPRHLVIHSRKSLESLAVQAQLVVKDVVFDSTEFQFWGSEQYRRGIPLESVGSYAVNPGNSMFNRRQIREFREKARELNGIGQGDQAAFYLVREAI